MADGRSALETAGWGVHWEELRVAYFTRTGQIRKADEPHLLAQKWRARRDALWDEAQKG